jgi:hypothetical protein
MNVHYQFILRFEKGLLKAILSTPRSHRCADSIFDYEYCIQYPRLRSQSWNGSKACAMALWRTDLCKIEKTGSLQCPLTMCHVLKNGEYLQWLFADFPAWAWTLQHQSSDQYPQFQSLKQAFSQLAVGLHLCRSGSKIFLYFFLSLAVIKVGSGPEGKPPGSSPLKHALIISKWNNMP